MREKLLRFGRLIKVEHTLFALPFSLGSMFLAARGAPQWSVAGWVLVAIISGRSLGMAANRVIDRHVDALNPRTQNRELPRGLLSLAEVLAFIALAAAVLLWAVLQLPPLCLSLLPGALILLIGYSYTKFFTSLSHFALGATLAVPVVGSRIAVTGQWESAVLWLALAVVVWVAGFDILYACQDIDFDRENGLHSIPARLGVATSLRLALTLHALVVPALVGFGLTQGYGRIYQAGMLVIAGILVWEHSICNGEDLSRIEKAFFVANAMVSLVFLATSIATVML